MMTQTEEHPPSLEGVLSQKADVQLVSLLAIKDDIIGHPLRKAAYIQQRLMPVLLQIVTGETTSADVKVEAIIVLGSLCHGSPVTEKLGVSHTDIIQTLTASLDPNMCPPQQVIASLRSLNIFCEFNPNLTSPHLSQTLHQPLTQIFQLHRKPLPKSLIIEQVQLAATLLERSCARSEMSDDFAELDTLDAMLSFMYSFVFATWDLQRDYSFNMAPPSIYSRLLPSLLYAIGAIIKDDTERATHVAAAKPSSPLVGAMFEEEYPMMRILLRLTKNIHGSIKLGAVECLTYMFRVGAVGRKEIGEINNVVVPILVRLFDDTPEVRMRAPQILGHLVTDSEEMQKVACDANAIKKLSEIILKTKFPPPNSSKYDEYSTHHIDKLKESALSAIAAITLFKDDYRKQVIDTGLIPSIVQAMSSPVPGIRAAACQCTRSLSRSVCILRTNLVDAGIALPLFRLLSDESLEVKIAATGAVCNLMLEFSPMRRAILEQGAMNILCNHTRSEFSQLRLNAVWALKHFCYQPDDTSQVESMLNELGYEQLMRLCDDEDVGVQEQALSVIRNVMTGEVKSIGLMFDNIGATRLMKLIVDKLGSPYPEIVAAAAYICVHIGSGTEAHRNTLISNAQVMRAILLHMDSPTDNVRIGCVWTIINLIVTEETIEARVECRVRALQLRELGIFDKLLRMKESDSSLDVKERAKSALAHLDGLQL